MDFLLWVIHNVLMSRYWTDTEIELLKTSYRSKENTELIDALNRDFRAIYTKSRELGLDWHRPTRKNKIHRLLEETPEKYYWLGFLLADGHFEDKKHPRITCNLANKDRAHLEKLADFLGTHVKSEPTRPLVALSVRGADVIREIILKYDIAANKTTCPPNIQSYGLTDVFALCVIIGFMDGDGCISDNGLRIHGDVGVHETWLENLNFMSALCNRVFQQHFAPPLVYNDDRRGRSRSGLRLLERNLSGIWF